MTNEITKLKKIIDNPPEYLEQPLAKKITITKLRSMIHRRLPNIIGRLYWLSQYGKTQSIQVQASRALMDKGLPALASLELKDSTEQQIMVKLNSFPENDQKPQTQQATRKPGYDSAETESNRKFTEKIIEGQTED